MNNYSIMRSAINSFIGFLFGGMIYSGLIQYSDTGSIRLYALVSNPKHWFIATFAATGVYILKKISKKNSKVEDSSDD